MFHLQFSKSCLGFCVAVIAAAPALGQSTTAPSATTSPPEATVYGVTIDREELATPLIETYGLNLLMLRIQLVVARHDAEAAKVSVTPEDVANERATTIKNLFSNAEPKDYAQLLPQFLQQQNMSMAQFDIVVETNAILRKIAQPLCAGKVSDANIKQAFDLQYGAKVQIRDIKVSRLLDAQKAKDLLAQGVSFEKVAKEMSIDPQTRDLGGLWPPFTSANTDIKDAIKEQAFALKEGDVSDAISTDNEYHVIKIEKKLAPAFAKFDDETKKYLRAQLEEKLMNEAIKYLRTNLAREVIQPGVLDIKDPVLKAQFDKRLADSQRQAAENQKAAQEQQLRNLIPSTKPATRP